MASHAAASSASASASSLAARRLGRELHICHRWNHEQIKVRPSRDGNLLELHFVLYNLPAPYSGGCYHGRLTFPREYPLKPPAIQMLTESGRFKTRQDICTTASNWHSERWNPDWTVMAILIGFLSLFLDESDRGIGHETFASMSNPNRRMKLAADSRVANAADEEFCSLFPDFLEQSEQALTDGVIPNSNSSEEAPAPCASSTSDYSTSSTKDATCGSGGESENAAESDGEDAILQCRICLDATSDEPLMDPLPCACRGSQGAVHASCLRRWILYSGNLKCGTCQTTYGAGGAAAAPSSPGRAPPPAEEEDRQEQVNKRLTLVTARLLSLYVGALLALASSGLIAITFLRQPVGLDLSLRTAGAYIAAMTLGCSAGRCLTRSQPRPPQLPGLGGQDKPILPIAAAILLHARIANRAGAEPEERILVAQSARPMVGGGFMLCCGVLFLATFPDWSLGLAVLWSLWLVLCNAHRIARTSVERHMVEAIGAEQRVLIDLMMSLDAAKAGAFWALVIACLTLGIVLPNAVRVPLDWVTFIFCLCSLLVGVVLGRLLMSSRFVERRVAAAGGDLVGLGEPLVGAGAAGAAAARGVPYDCATLAARRVQVSRAAHLDLVRAAQIKIAMGCFVVCLAAFLATVGATGDSSLAPDCGLAGMSIVWTGLHGATRVALCRYRAEWHARMRLAVR